MAFMDTPLPSTSPVSTPASHRPARTASALGLDPGAAQACAVKAGATLAVLAGRLWITLDDDPDDHFVAAGQRWTADRAGRCVLQGDGSGASFWRWLR